MMEVMDDGGYGCWEDGGYVIVLDGVTSYHSNPTFSISKSQSMVEVSSKYLQSILIK